MMIIKQNNSTSIGNVYLNIRIFNPPKDRFFLTLGIKFLWIFAFHEKELLCGMAGKNSQFRKLEPLFELGTIIFYLE